MTEIELITVLSECRASLTEAANNHDWDRVAMTDQQILAVVKDVPPEQRQGLLAEELQQIRQAYRQILSVSDDRRSLLQKKMACLRDSKNALAGYQASLTAVHLTPGV